MKLTTEVIEIIESRAFRDALETNDFNRMYHGGIIPLDGKTRGAITYLFLSFDINPLMYMTEVPIRFAQQLDFSNIHLDIPNGIKVLQYGCFMGCTGLGGQYITIPDTVEIIESRAFMSSDIENVVIGRNVREINSNAFVYCDKLQNVKIKTSKWDLYDGSGSHVSTDKLGEDSGIDARLLVDWCYLNWKKKK